ncbi:CaiB/BaiF CoA transferase family protein [Microbacterium sp. No. 7]|uniref:CaiB/BaiF CoA transferase family protein n=1 Tax=Microbacterium sp. No. 7 TaxID=1714373 RepID=UPI0006D118B6|nr:CoA transferase [Microbacterium sp. No. 7]ALJ19261.1 acetyl-CoA acetyltransferase [Microbacterium sp. No. 7]
MTGPLEGIRILDLTSNFMGPYGTLLLADMGADVVKIEAPAGDTTRGVGPARNPGMGAIFLHLNRNKRSMCIDLKTEQGAATLRRMATSADVVFSTMRPAAIARLGLSYDELSAENPGLVYCAAYGFGRRGRYADKPAYDDLIQAAVGLPVMQSKRVGEPAYVASAIADRVVGMYAAVAISSALVHRERTGKGQQIDVPMFESFAQFAMGDHLYGLSFEPPIGTSGYARMMSPDRRPYKTLDGYIAVMVYVDKHWHRFFELAGRPEMKDDPRFGTIAGRTRNIDHLYRFVGETLAHRTTAEWVRLLEEADIPVMPMNTPETLIEDPHMRDVGFFVEEEHPTEGLIRQMAIPHEWSATPPDRRLPPPRLGENSAEVLAEYGFSEAEVQELLASHAVRTPAVTVEDAR